MDEQWVVLREHLMNPSLLALDGGAVALLGLEAELQAQGIEVVFDPFRPGEGFVSRSLAQPFRLLVKRADFARAEEIAREMEEASQADDAAAESDDGEQAPPEQ